MIEIRQTTVFRSWLHGLKDKTVRTVIVSRIDRLGAGLPGDVAAVGEGISELRIHGGPGYRVYFVQRGKTVLVLLCGGNKRTQHKDIDKAKELAAQWSA